MGKVLLGVVCLFIAESSNADCFIPDPNASDACTKCVAQESDVDTQLEHRAGVDPTFLSFMSNYGCTYCIASSIPICTSDPGQCMQNGPVVAAHHHDKQWTCTNAGAFLTGFLKQEKEQKETASKIIGKFFLGSMNQHFAREQTGLWKQIIQASRISDAAGSTSCRELLTNKAKRCRKYTRSSSIGNQHGFGISFTPRCPDSQTKIPKCDEKTETMFGSQLEAIVCCGAVDGPMSNQEARDKYK